MPLYPYQCENELCPDAGREVCVFKPCKDSSRVERCPKCSKALSRTFCVNTSTPFQTFYDEQYKTEISSRKQEERLMKSHGHVYARDAFGKKYEAQRKEAKWKISRGFGTYGINAKKEKVQK